MPETEPQQVIYEFARSLGKSLQDATEILQSRIHWRQNGNENDFIQALDAYRYAAQQDLLNAEHVKTLMGFARGWAGPHSDEWYSQNQTRILAYTQPSGHTPKNMEFLIADIFGILAQSEIGIKALSDSGVFLKDRKSKDANLPDYENLFSEWGGSATCQAAFICSALTQSPAGRRLLIDQNVYTSPVAVALFANTEGGREFLRENPKLLHKTAERRNPGFLPLLGATDDGLAILKTHWSNLRYDIYRDLSGLSICDTQSSGMLSRTLGVIEGMTKNPATAELVCTPGMTDALSAASRRTRFEARGAEQRSTFKGIGYYLNPGAIDLVHDAVLKSMPANAQRLGNRAA